MIKKLSSLEYQMHTHIEGADAALENFKKERLALINSIKKVSFLSILKAK